MSSSLDFSEGNSAENLRNPNPNILSWSDAWHEH